jgi:hypothetical protein
MKFDSAKAIRQHALDVVRDKRSSEADRYLARQALFASDELDLMTGDELEAEEKRVLRAMGGRACDECKRTPSNVATQLEMVQGDLEALALAVIADPTSSLVTKAKAMVELDAVIDPPSDS